MSLDIEMEHIQYSIFRMLSKSKSNRSLLPSKDISLTHLAKLSAYLDHEHLRTKYVNKEIKNEIQMGKKNDGVISKTISNINCNGEELASRYEEEKEKCQKLEFLVGYIEEEIYRGKLDKANDLKNNIEIDRIAEMTEVLTSKQKLLERISQKTNTSSYDISKKIDTIRALRSERTIVSALFDKIERELCNLEHCYKVLVIERKKEQDELERTVGEFNQCEARGEKELVKIKYQCSRLRKGLMKSIAKINTLNTETELKEGNRMSIFNERSSLGEQLKVVPTQRKKSQKEREAPRQKTHKFEGDLQKLNRERTVKQIFNALGISSIKSLPDDLSSLESSNQNLLNESDRLYQQIFTVQVNLQRLSNLHEYSPVSSQRKSLVNQRKNVLKESSQQIQKSRLQLSEFKEGCKILLGSIREAQGEDPEQLEFINDQEEIVYLMGQLQKFFQKSYVGKGSSVICKSKKQKILPKRLTHLLTANQFQHCNTSIFQEKDLLEYARKNLQKMDKTQRGQSSRVEK